MKVTHAGDTRFPWERVGRTLSAGAVVSGVCIVPAIVFPAYPRAVATLLVVCTLGAVSRLTWDTVWGYREPPRPPDVDGQLPTVSVVVTAYDEAPVLRGTMQALRELDYPDDRLEILVCYESASSDGTAEIATSLAANVPSFRAIERMEPPGGKAAVTNFGLRRATGEILCVLDADQQFESDAIRRAVRWFRSDEDIWCVTGRRYGRNPAESLVALHATVEHHFVERFVFYARGITGGFALFTGGQAFFRAETFDDLGLFAEDVLLEDVDMATRIHTRGKSIRVDPGIVSTEVNPGSFRDWWHQRVRWARGGLQVGRRHLLSLLRSPSTSNSTKIGGISTFVPLFAVPLIALTTPVLLLGVTDIQVAPFFPDISYAVLACSVAVGSLLPAVVFVRDTRDGRHHDPIELLVPLTFWLYALLQTVVLVTAFLDEVVLSTETVYVPS